MHTKAKSMTKSEYALLLTDPRWNEVRLRILKRDNYRCRHCKADNCRLNVHHKVYLPDKMPWEVPDKHLVSLCDNCHTKAHAGRLISTFIKGTPQRKEFLKNKRENRKKPGKQVKKVWIAGKGLVEVPKKKSNKK